MPRLALVPAPTSAPDRTPYARAVDLCSDSLGSERVAPLRALFDLVGPTPEVDALVRRGLALVRDVERTRSALLASGIEQRNVTRAMLREIVADAAPELTDVQRKAVLLTGEHHAARISMLEGETEQDPEVQRVHAALLALQEDAERTLGVALAERAHQRTSTRRAPPPAPAHVEVRATDSETDDGGGKTLSYADHVAKLAASGKRAGTSRTRSDAA